MIKTYFSNAEKYSTPRFIIELTVVCFVLKFISVFIASIIFAYFKIPTQVDNSFEVGLIHGGLLPAIVQIIIFASFETLTGQWLVIWLVSKFSKSNFWKILISAIIFSALHVEAMLMAAVFPIGLILSWTFLIKSKKSRSQAFWITTSIHVLHNLIVLWLVSMNF